MRTRRYFINLISSLACFVCTATSALPRKGVGKMKKFLQKASSRGKANYGWLKSAHSFSFAHYYNPEQMGFGLLRVLNDDFVAPGHGFDTHPHRDMEIVSIPLAGSLHHQDSEGHEQVIKHGEVQLMSAGTGVFHSEYNASDKEAVNFLQIWVMPDKLGIVPRYDQKKFSKLGRHNKLQTIVSPLDTDDEGVKINQNAYFSLLDLDVSKSLTYQKKVARHGVYIFLINGQLDVSGSLLNTRDAIGLLDMDQIELKAVDDAQVLIIEIPFSK